MKKQITLRIDEEVLEWFKSQGKGYQGRMNDALRNYMLADGYGPPSCEHVIYDDPDTHIKMIPNREFKVMISPVSDEFFKPMPKTGKKKR